LLIFLSQRALEKWKKIKEEQVKERELLNKERIQKERFWAKACIACNTKLLPDAHFCSNC
jgi:rRNA maturation endonuclease Nob1